MGGLDHFAAGQGQQHRTGGRSLHSAADGRRQRRVFGSHVVECAVWLDVVQRHTRRIAEGFQCANLIHYIGLSFGGADCHFAAAKALQVGQTGVCAHLHAVFFAQQYALFHHGRVSRVEPAGNVRAGHVG